MTKPTLEQQAALNFVEGRKTGRRLERGDIHVEALRLQGLVEIGVMDYKKALEMIIEFMAKRKRTEQ